MSDCQISYELSPSEYIQLIHKQYGICTDDEFRNFNNFNPNKNKYQRKRSVPLNIGDSVRILICKDEKMPFISSHIYTVETCYGTTYKLVGLNGEYNKWQLIPINKPIPTSDNNKLGLSFGELWWNNVSKNLDEVPLCRTCIKDLETFNRLVIANNLNEIRIFDTNKSKLRKCSSFCLWFHYFKTHRKGQ